MKNGWLGGENQDKGSQQRETRWLTPTHIPGALGNFDLDPCGAPGHELANTTYMIDNPILTYADSYRLIEIYYIESEDYGWEVRVVYIPDWSLDGKAIQQTYQYPTQARALVAIRQIEGDSK